ncbi:MAG TPA: folylpolyglutamate synthase/dihydrofolate synthase family protein [Candidatus Hydrogenedentes bacterium]|jgi:dihydrofolate synthase/folylpolyglutamate synthase|nr:MAG: Folylpolyglutamate synthase [Candidatus Hydrogenedentes bacterium ADurb.Bin170]HNZ47719.1 folylpolyglutamate synthase/dihydrofolate synthase family protein [Candidatus Hydrogenedentota bacterium]HOD95110.1 folylpolyglutamate synthase/dihydrofolate synthase family protein [Candidatus Hydrogenedentota bacterium]HOM47198.1 folylpolyglutamate synthase/dihydrofolate synthase family protein [Candidatus Hydrogenedentota bacterium]HOR51379.1 folylpolyglutamate synthase/dihydrofolate synthase fa
MQNDLSDGGTGLVAEPSDALAAREYLDSLILHGIKLGLSNIEAILREGGEPQYSCPVVHVGGTNGKGSVLAFLDAMLLAAGYRTGRFSSPHLLDVTERFLIDAVPVCNATLEESAHWCQLMSARALCVPTYFEANTAMAFYCFQKKKVDVALLEVGMGGRFDSTNVVQPRICAITNIALDHTRYLGSTLAEIAFEKAGILKKNIPAVLGRIDPEAQRVIEQEAAARAVPLFRWGIEYEAEKGGSPLTPVLTYRGNGKVFENVQLGLAGMHQIENAAIALTVALQLQSDFPRLTDSAIISGLEKAVWPGRLERLLDSPPVLMDVAHNPAGCAALVEAVDNCTAVFAVSSDKDAATMLALLKRIARPLILTCYTGERSLPLTALRQFADSAQCIIVPSLAEALEAGKREASPEKPLLITGSIYACGEARDYMIRNWGVSAPAFRRS